MAPSDGTARAHDHAALLTAVMREAGLMTTEAVTHTTSQVVDASNRSRTVREYLTYDSPPPSLTESVIVKTFFRSVDDLEWLETEREVRFFAELFPAVEPTPGLPNVLYATLKGPDDLPVVVSADVGTLPPPDPIAGCSPEATIVAIDALANVHASAWGNQDLPRREWLRPLDAVGYHELRERARLRLPNYLAETGSELPTGAADLLARGVAGDIKMAGPVTNTILHGAPGPTACHLDGAGRLIALRSWNEVAWGSAAHDLAWLLGGVLSIADRRAFEGRFLATHMNALAGAGIDVDPEDHRQRYLVALLTPLLANVAGDVSEHPAVLRRRAAAALDHHG